MEQALFNVAPGLTVKRNPPFSPALLDVSDVSETGLTKCQVQVFNITRDGRRLRIYARAQTGHWLYGCENLL